MRSAQKVAGARISSNGRTDASFVELRGRNDVGGTFWPTRPKRGLAGCALCSAHQPSKSRRLHIDSSGNGGFDRTDRAGPCR